MTPDEDPLATTVLNFPVFDSPPRHPLPRKMTWDEVMDQTEPQRRFYMRHFDSPEKRLQNKNPAPFQLHSPGCDIGQAR